MGAVRYKDQEADKTQEFSETCALNKTELSGMVEIASEGNFEVFGKLYNIYLGQIYRYVFYQVRDRMTAEDLTEEIFIKAWEALGRYKQRSGTFSAWLYRIAHNHVIDYFRTTRQHLALNEEMPAAGSLEQEAEAKLMQQELAEVISLLPPQQKQVIILKFIEGLDDSEIAQIMQKRQGTIRVIQTRALAALRQRLSSEENRCKLNYLKPLANV
jgi:RNA polymerase sigma-70 factor (ECF subfamily)